MTKTKSIDNSEGWQRQAATGSLKHGQCTCTLVQPLWNLWAVRPNARSMCALWPKDASLKCTPTKNQCLCTRMFREVLFIIALKCKPNKCSSIINQSAPFNRKPHSVEKSHRRFYTYVNFYCSIYLRFKHLEVYVVPH